MVVYPMKKTTLATAAAILIATTAAGSAADMAVKAPYAAPAPIYNWTGFYIGGHVGGGWGTTETTLTGATITPPGGPAATAAFGFPFAQNSTSGFLGGGQIGYNWQAGWAVFGVQADIAGLDVKGTTPCVILLSCTTKSDWLATATGRIGAVVADRGLVYVKGGAAWLNSTNSVSLPNIGLGGITGGELTSKETTTWGWTVGLGLEYMIAQNWSAFIEYDYMDFDRKNETFNLNLAALGVGAGAISVNADLKNKLSIAKVGVNYKF
jgi:outer membrane immunogenic protein